MEQKKRPTILVSNDDGVSAKGLQELVKMIRPLGEVVVMAPDSPRSGSACCITCVSPVRFSLVKQEEGLTVYQCSGTPTDCVKLALSTVMKETPALVIGGINHGDNSAASVHYSGTMGVVLEGCMKGIPSIGFSLCNYSADADFSPMTSLVQQLVKKVLDEGLPEGVCLNVNFPDRAEYEGVMPCRQGRGQWTSEWVRRVHPRGGDYYWLTGEFKAEDEREEADYVALQRGYVTVTPIRVDMTDEPMLATLKDWNLK